MIVPCIAHNSPYATDQEFPAKPGRWFSLALLLEPPALIFGPLTGIIYVMARWVLQCDAMRRIG